MKIVIDNTEVQERSFTSKAGKDFTFRQQEAWADLGGRYPEKILIDLYDSSPFPVGDYEVESRSFRVNAYRKLEFGRFYLKPLTVKG